MRFPNNLVARLMTYFMRRAFERSRSKTVDLVVEHELRGITPEMLDWWWGHINNTERYKLWHPRAHLSFEWEVPPAKSGHVGATQVVLEKIGGIPNILRIRWEESSSVPIPTTYSHVIAASILGRDDVPIAWITHEYEAEPYGTRMRSTFRLPAKTPRMYRNALRKHNKEEMQQFPEFLPELYARDLG